MDFDITRHGNGEPVVFVHGGGAADEFLPLLHEPALERFRLISYRRRGYGYAGYTGPVSVEQHAADCAAVLTKAGVDRAHVVGKSFGALVALQLAADEPNLVHSLTLLEPTLAAVPSGPQLLRGLAPVAQLYRDGDPGGAVHAYLTAVWGVDWRAEFHRAVPGGPKQAERDAAGLFESDLPQLASWALPAELSQPVLHVLGTQSSPVFAEGRDLLAARLPQLEVAVLPGLNHLLQLRDPARVAAVVAGFLHHHPMEVAAR
ncbi:alpha/beta fold hydrolase [Prauserella cavernicola]|uniref:Alpha/beta hydrolase n=1 Tax=Prauserella cavernicola TaxID=2800127 RepID=A0A934V7R9_9PSEU|nr:alpha/beta hydrolase [Prauserella cavernicola]MBK1787018.1 alpha/beta hydrolase [Prauserella cavernicola]